MTEQLVEHLGFAPIHFFDKVLEIANSSLQKSLYNLEIQLEDKIGLKETQREMAEIESLAEQSIDARFDRFELFVLNNVFNFRKPYILPHYQQRYLSLKLKEHEEIVDQQLAQLRDLNQKLLEMHEIAQQAELEPVSDTISKLNSDYESSDKLMNTIEQRTGDLDWSNFSTVPNTRYVDSEIMHHLKKRKGEDANPLSAWDITSEYRDALMIGSAKALEQVNAVLVDR
ncbi:hypothetical protein HK103_003591 [Boothiomyces macroporosus]|uniref:Uncharacterized protein n=1 Tax=Boothiomyces macroporosus TaxID=261099 RepID=A0AAD5Y8W3_9FUNG|nr:hypothetical protein HK103_003591 [Boothiomyces macroporosus]